MLSTSDEPRAHLLLLHWCVAWRRMADLLAYDSELTRQAGADGVPPRVVTLKAIAAAAARLLEEPSLLLDNQREAFLLLHRGDVGVCPIQTLQTHGSR